MAKKTKVLQKPQCIEHIIELQFIQPLSFNLLVGFGKRLLNGLSHKTQMTSLKQLTKFTHFLETNTGWDDQMRGSHNWQTSRTFWRQVWSGMNRCGVFK